MSPCMPFHVRVLVPGRATRPILRSEGAVVRKAVCVSFQL